MRSQHQPWRKSSSSSPLPASVDFFRTFAGELAGPRGEEVRRRYVEDMGARDENLARWIADLMCTVPLPIAAAVVRGIYEWNGAEALALCAVPTLLLRARLDDHSDALRLRAIKPDIEIGITVGAGHFHQLEVPEQVNSMIERFLSVAVG